MMKMPAKFSKVDKHLYRGGQPELHEISILKDVLGIDRIVSLDGPIGSRIADTCKKNNIEHIILPLTDGNGDNIEKLPKLINMISNNGKTYIHCRHGKDRTSLACALYRIFVEGWDLEKAAIEAYKFGMGMGLAPHIKKSYYLALKKLHNEINETDDIATIQRNDLTNVQPLTNSEFQNPSFAPFSDVEVDHLNRPAYKLQNIVKQASVRIYKYCLLPEVLNSSKIWSNTPDEARRIADGNLTNAKMFEASISKTANVIEYPYELTKSLIHAAILNEADVIVFKAANSTTQIYVVNPLVLSINNINYAKNDMNDVPLVGEHDNYTGLSTQFAPGSGGILGSGGGFAGMIEAPFTQEL